MFAIQEKTPPPYINNHLLHHHIFHLIPNIMINDMETQMQETRREEDESESESEGESESGLMMKKVMEEETCSMKEMDEEASVQFAQINMLRDIFARFDMDSDGSLTILEMAAVLRSMGLRPSPDQIPILLANMDSNGNGFIEFDELVHAILPSVDRQILINQEHLMKVFQLFDLDRNGLITPSELAKSMAKMGQPLTWRELTEMIKEADTNEDGVISFSEFASVLAKSVTDYLGVDVHDSDDA